MVRGPVSVLLFDSTPAWNNKRRLLYVKLLTPPYPPPLLRPGWATVAQQLLTTSTTLSMVSTFFGFWQFCLKDKNRATFSKKPSPEHPVSDRPKCQAQLVAYGIWSRSRVQMGIVFSDCATSTKMVLLLKWNECKINRSQKWTNLIRQVYMWFQEEQGSCLVTYTAVDTKLMYLLFW